MVQTTETKAQNNRNRVKAYYDSHKDEINKNRILKKLDEGKPVRKSTLDKYGIPNNLKTDLEKSNEKLIQQTKNKVMEQPTPVEQQTIHDASKKVTPLLVYDAFRRGNKEVYPNGIYTTSTIKLYTKRFKNIITFLKGNDESDLKKLFKDSKKVLNIIKKNVNANEYKDYLNCISTLCNPQAKHLLPEYCEVLDKQVVEFKKNMKLKLDESNAENLTNTKHKDIVNFNDIEKAKQTIKQKQPNSFDHLLIEMYVFNAFRDDLSNVRIIKKKEKVPKEKNNYYDVNTSNLILRDYKTSSKFGEKRYKLPNPIVKIIDYQMKKEPNKKYLFEKSNNTPYAKLSSKVTSAFEEADLDNISINVIRHSRVAKLWGKPKALLIQKKKLADLMMHDVTTAGMIYDRKEKDPSV